MAPLFVVQEIPDRDAPEQMKRYMEKTGKKTVKGTKKLLGVMRVKKILLYTPLIKWYFQRGLELTAVHQLAEYEPGKHGFQRRWQIPGARLIKISLKSKWMMSQNQREIVSTGK